MAALVFTLATVELIAYGVRLAQLARVTKERQPELAREIGAPGPWDYVVWGFGPGDRFVSKLEARWGEIAHERRILKLARMVRGVYVAFLLTMCAWVFVIVSHAN